VLSAALPHWNELLDAFKDKPVRFIAITDENQQVVENFLKQTPIHSWVGLVLWSLPGSTLGVGSWTFDVRLLGSLSSASSLLPLRLLLLCAFALDGAGRSNLEAYNIQGIPTTVMPTRKELLLFIRPNSSRKTSTRSNAMLACALWALTSKLASALCHHEQPTQCLTPIPPTRRRPPGTH
jgi:hypothetical protein